MSPRTRHWALLAVAAVALRGPLLLLSPGAAYDMESYTRVAAIPGPGLYSAAATVGRYPYLPLWWLLLRSMAGLRAWLGGDPGIWMRVPGVAGDLAVSLLLYSLAERRSRGAAALNAGGDHWRSERAGLVAGLGWALNPLAALVSAAHGQFDSLALALLLLAAWFLEYARQPRSEWWAALCLAAAIALKTWPLAFLPFYLGSFPSLRERLRFSVWVLVPPLLLLLPWLAWDGPGAVAGHLGYSGATALGLSGALRAACYALGASADLYRRLDGVWRALAEAALTLGFAAGLWQCRRLRLLEGLPWAALLLLLLAPGLSPQYLAWPVALALAVNPRLALRLGLACLPLLLAFYALFMPAVLAGGLAWPPPRLGQGATLLWALANLLWWTYLAAQWSRLSPQVFLGRPRGAA
jgi:hypothetical protein